MTYEANHVRRWLVGLLAVLLVSVALAPAADAHYYRADTIARAIVDSNYDGACGKGTFWRCGYKGYPQVWGYRAPHVRYFRGYFQHWNYSTLRLYECFVGGQVRHKRELLFNEWKCRRV